MPLSLQQAATAATADGRRRRRSRGSMEGEGSSSGGLSGEGKSPPVEPRRLKGHKRAATCCIASRAQPGVIASSGEDGCICWFDLRCKDVLFTIDVGKKPITSLCFKSGNEDVIYASSGTEVIGFDIHVASSWKPLEIYNYNREEINQIVFSPKSYFLAAADDSGDVKIIDTRQQCLYKTLRAVHTSICSSVQFLSWKPWSVITGGLDSKLVTWDFSRGRPHSIIDFGMPNLDAIKPPSSQGQCFNPAFVHSIAVPEVEMHAGLDKVCAVARGDGIVGMIDIESEMIASKPRNSSQPRKGSQPKTKATTVLNGSNHTVGQSQGKRVQLDYELGGHTAAVSCVSFSLFGERGRFIISGGNDAFVKVWDWSKHFLPEQMSCNSDLYLSIKTSRKINWLCTTPTDSDNLIICDTSKVLKAYTIS